MKIEKTVTVTLSAQSSNMSPAHTVDYEALLDDLLEDMLKNLSENMGEPDYNTVYLDYEIHDTPDISSDIKTSKLVEID